MHHEHEQCSWHVLKLFNTYSAIPILYSTQMDLKIILSSNSVCISDSIIGQTESNEKIDTKCETHYLLHR